MLNSSMPMLCTIRSRHGRMTACRITLCAREHQSMPAPHERRMRLANVLPLGGPGEAARKAPEADIQLKNLLRSVGWGWDGELLRVGRELQGERGREAQRGAAAGSFCAAGLKTH